MNNFRFEMGCDTPHASEMPLRRYELKKRLSFEESDEDDPDHNDQAGIDAIIGVSGMRSQESSLVCAGKYVYSFIERAYSIVRSALQPKDDELNRAKIWYRR